MERCAFTMKKYYLTLRTSRKGSALPTGIDDSYADYCPVRPHTGVMPVFPAFTVRLEHHSSLTAAAILAGIARPWFGSLRRFSSYSALIFMAFRKKVNHLALPTGKIKRVLSSPALCHDPEILQCDGMSSSSINLDSAWHQTLVDNRTVKKQKRLSVKLQFQ